MAEYKALVAGSTGLIGSLLLDRLLSDDYYSEIHIISRRSTGIENPRLTEHIIDFDQLSETELPRIDDVFCALGTTRKQAGSHEAFARVDYTYVVELAAKARELGARQFLVVSSIMANPRSRNEYLQTKGFMEEAVKDQGPPTVQIFRPATLLGQRETPRFNERAGQVFMGLIKPLLVGKYAKYRNIPAAVVAEAMQNAAKNGVKGQITYESDAIALLADI